MSNWVKKIFARIRKMIGTGLEAGDNIAFWIVYGIPGMLVIILIITYFMKKLFDFIFSFILGLF